MKTSLFRAVQQALNTEVDNALLMKCFLPFQRPLDLIPSSWGKYPVIILKAQYNEMP